METEEGLSSKRYNSVHGVHGVQDVFMVFPKRTLNSLDVFRHSVEKPRNMHYTASQLYSI